MEKKGVKLQAQNYKVCLLAKMTKADAHKHKQPHTFLLTLCGRSIKKLPHYSIMKLVNIDTIMKHHIIDVPNERTTEEIINMGNDVMA